jgi:hypothetical protein
MDFVLHKLSSQLHAQSNTSSAPKYLTLVFYTNFDHSSYLKNKIMKNQIYI